MGMCFPTRGIRKSWEHRGMVGLWDCCSNKGTILVNDMVILGEKMMLEDCQWSDDGYIIYIATCAFLMSTFAMLIGSVCNSLLVYWGNDK